MALSVTNYKCPACTGPLHYSEKSGKLECEYCGSSYEVKEIEALQGKKDEAAAEALEQQEEKRAKEKERRAEEEALGIDGGMWSEADGVRLYMCPSCGAELICDDNTAATSCPYCGNNAIIPGKLSGTYRPEYVLPFKMSKNDAIAALKRHYSGKKFLPKAFTDENHIEEIKGVYVPFWLFDATAVASVDFDASNSSSSHQGDYLVTETKHYDVHRAGELRFEKLPVDASTKMPDGHMDSIEPFDYSEIKDFSTSYLPGFLADKYDVSAEDSKKRARERAATSAVSMIAGTVSGYESHRVLRQDVRFKDESASYALLPVWMLSTKWNGQNYLFAMNGQTGKLVGDLPVDRGLYLRRFILTMLGIAVPVGLLFSFLI